MSDWELVSLKPFIVVDLELWRKNMADEQQKPKTTVEDAIEEPEEEDEETEDFEDEEDEESEEDEEEDE